MNLRIKRWVSLLCAIVLLWGVSIVALPQPTYAISASKNTQDFINNVLKGMPSYTPSKEYLYVSHDGVVYEIDAIVLVSAMVQNEIIGSDGGSGPGKPLASYTEAYKAQAVAAHSFVKFTNNKGTAITGGKGTISYRKPHADTVAIVNQVIKKLVYYKGSIAQTFYAASSGLHTQGNEFAWGGTPIPYLRGVACKYDEAVATKTYSLTEMTNILKNRGFNPTGNPATWFQIPTTTTKGDMYLSDGGFIVYMRLCGQRIDGDKLKSIFSLKSYKATVSYNASQQQFTITTRGFGHGVGLSQVSALGYAQNDGWNYERILKHFFTGVTIEGADTDGSSNVKIGDVNQDGKVSVSDISLIQDYIKGRVVLTAVQKKAADANGDGKVSVSDISLVQDHIKGRVTLK